MSYGSLPIVLCVTSQGLRKDLYVHICWESSDDTSWTPAGLFRESMVLQSRGLHELLSGILVCLGVESHSNAASSNLSSFGVQSILDCRHSLAVDAEAVSSWARIVEVFYLNFWIVKNIQRKILKNPL